MTQKSKSFQSWNEGVVYPGIYDQVKLQAWYGTKDRESTEIYCLVDEMMTYLRLKGNYERRAEIAHRIDHVKKNGPPSARKTLGNAMQADPSLRPINALVYHTIEAFWEIRETKPKVAPPKKKELCGAVSKRLGRKIAPKEWERALANSRLYVLDEAKAGRPKLATNKAKPRR